MAAGKVRAGTKFGFMEKVRLAVANAERTCWSTPDELSE